MMFDQLGKMKELQSKMEEVKNRLESIILIGEAGNGEIKVMCNGNKKIKNVEINNTLFKTADKEQVEELVVVATNRALEQADKVNEAEMQSAAMGMLGGFSGLK
jgi:DNA-binding YbaB/EbfC family protein